jgi:hypothetical protein
MLLLGSALDVPKTFGVGPINVAPLKILKSCGDPQLLFLIFDGSIKDANLYKFKKGPWGAPHNLLIRVTIHYSL